MSESLVIDVWSDVVCPFCYLGSHRLDDALAQFEHRDHVEVRRRAFELDPSAPHDYGVTLPELLAKKYAMPIERARSLNQRLEAEAGELGLSWSMKDAKPANTFDAHRLIALASHQSKGAVMTERLFRAYFSDGLLISDRDTLTTLALECSVSDAPRLWSGDEFIRDVRDDERRASELGITGVPSFVIDERLMVVGAQGSDQLLKVLNEAWSSRAAA
jgi:predicted DsbA family dithiol-disulfide isomerase